MARGNKLPGGQVSQLITPAELIARDRLESDLLCHVRGCNRRKKPSGGRGSQAFSGVKQNVHSMFARFAQRSC